MGVIQCPRPITVSTVNDMLPKEFKTVSKLKI
jgi:hypothetical protein